MEKLASTGTLVVISHKELKQCVEGIVHSAFCP